MGHAREDGTHFRDVDRPGLGQDYADQLYYSSWGGRFWTPDPAACLFDGNSGAWETRGQSAGFPRIQLSMVFRKSPQSGRNPQPPNLPAPSPLAGVYCEPPGTENLGSCFGSICLKLCRLTHPLWGNTVWRRTSTGHHIRQQWLDGFDICNVMPFSVNSR
jgi:hypothetical protein